MNYKLTSESTTSLNAEVPRINMELCLCPGVQSTMDEETEEGGPPSKTTLSGEHGRHSRAKRRKKTKKEKR